MSTAVAFTWVAWKPLVGRLGFGMPADPASRCALKPSDWM